MECMINSQATSSSDIEEGSGSTNIISKSGIEPEFLVDQGDIYELDCAAELKVESPAPRGLHFKILTTFTLLLVIFQIWGTIANHDRQFIDGFVTFLISTCVLTNLYIVYRLNIQFSIDISTRLKLYPCVLVAIFVLIFPWGYVSAPSVRINALDCVVISIVILFVTFVCYGITIEAVGIYSTIEVCLSDTRSRLVYNGTGGKVKHFVFKRHVDNDDFDHDNVKRLMSKYAELDTFGKYLGWKITSFVPLFFTCTVLTLQELMFRSSVTLHVILSDCAALCVVSYAILLAGSYNRRLSRFESTNFVNLQQVKVKVFGFEVTEGWLVASVSFLLSLIVKITSGQDEVHANS